MNEIAETIVQQLGGLALLRLMLGTRRVTFNDHGIRFDIRGCAKINYVQIDYDAGMDLYQMKFFRVSTSKASLNLVSEYDGVYADQLCDIIESKTGLFLGLVRIQIAGQYAPV